MSANISKYRRIKDMPVRKIPLEQDQIYHIYNRGVNKDPIFFSDRNYQFFIDRMFKNLCPNSDIIAYCLMPNHFHLILRVKSIELSKNFLQLFFMSYVKAVNKERDRVGPLFQDRYQSNLIEDEIYLLECVKYVHLNPVTAGLVKNPELWPYSSYRDYIHNNLKSHLNLSIIMTYFDNLQEFQEYTES